MTDRVGAMLLARGLITSDQLDTLMPAPGVTAGRRILSEVHARGWASESALAGVLATQLEQPVVVLSASVLDLDVVRLFSLALLREAQALPLLADAQTVSIALGDAQVPFAVEQAAAALGRRVVPVLALHSMLAATLPEVLSAAGHQRSTWSGKGAAGAAPHVELAAAAPSMSADERDAAARAIIAAAEGEPRARLGAIRLKKAHVRAQGAGSGAPAATAAPAAAPVVLVVDDDEDIRRMLRAAFVHDGLDVIEAADGAQAAKILHAQRPDVVVLDAMLPHVHGLQLCGALKQSPRHAGVPVIMMSAVYLGLDNARAIQEIHLADAFVEKPFEVHYLRGLVAAMLKRPPPRATLEPEAIARVAVVRAELDACCQAGAWEQACVALDQWFLADPFDAEAWVKRGELALKLNQDLSAVASFETACAFDPSSFAAATALALTYTRFGFVRRARTQWERARTLAPDAAAQADVDKQLEAGASLLARPR